MTKGPLGHPTGRGGDIMPSSTGMKRLKRVPPRDLLELIRSVGSTSSASPSEIRRSARHVLERLASEPEALIALNGRALRTAVRVFGDQVLGQVLLALRDTPGAGDVLEAVRCELDSRSQRRPSVYIDLTSTGSPGRRAAKRWAWAGEALPYMAASPVPSGRLPRPVGVGRVRAVARVRL